MSKKLTIRTGYDAFLVACSLSILTAWITFVAFPPSFLPGEPPIHIVKTRVVNKDQSRIAQEDSRFDHWRQRTYQMPWGHR